MAVRLNLRRYVFLVHRWTGVAMCVLMALWFISGVVMLFVGYPKLTPSERLAALPVLASSADGGDCCIGPAQALQHSAAPQAVQAITLTTIAGAPYYVFREGDSRITRVAAGVAGSGAGITASASNTDAASATDAAGTQGRVYAAAALAAARLFRPGATVHYGGIVDEDRWTRGKGLNPHRPLHVVEIEDRDATRVYVSSVTGQVVLDAPRAQRYWNYLGAWLHWLYLLRDRPVDPVWSWTVIGLSALGVVSAFTGLLNGIWRWRFRGRYKHGSRTPYREATMRWHHLLGLGFGFVLCTWIFSGLMSMNPLGVFSAARRPHVAAMAGAAPGAVHLDVAVSDVLARLQATGFAARELEWHVQGGQPFILARGALAAGGRGGDGGGESDHVMDSRIVTVVDGAITVRERWPQAQLAAAAARLLPYPVTRMERLQAHDAWYYAREQASMYGGNERRLPVLRMTFADPGATVAYLDVHTGQLALSLDRRERVGRWLFNFLHSWDLPVLLQPAWPRESVLVLLSVGGLLLSATAVVIGWRRLRLHGHFSATVGRQP